MTCFFKDFILVTSYFPNAGIDGAKRLDYRVKEWDPDFRHFLKEELEVGSGKPVILCGDLNVASQEIDTYKKAKKKSTPSVIRTLSESFAPLLSNGFVDTFRQ